MECSNILDSNYNLKEYYIQETVMMVSEQLKLSTLFLNTAERYQTQ